MVQAILQRYPNICWFRGTDYYENESGVPVASRFATLGANGYLGDARAVSYAAKNYNGETHADPVLFIARLDALLEGVESGAIELGTEHNYDVTLAPRNNMYNEWAIKNLIICDLGNSPEDFARAAEILESKAVL